MSETQLDVTIWLLVACAALAVTAYEIAGLTLDGWHTISYWGHRSKLVRIAIFCLFAAGGLWWLGHASHLITK